MKIEIQRLELTNFKCFRHKEITFNSDVTTIKGRNGVGKTTIADAILWCLFGKNSQGQSDFDLKTHDENGKPISNLDHSVEMELYISTPVRMVKDNSTKYKYETVTLKRTLKETWIKKRGSEEQVFKNNTTEYLINGDSCTAADYKKYISVFVNEEVFKAITNPSYFPSLKWQVQREFLSKLAGEISDMEIFKIDEGLDILSSDITSDIIGYRKHLSYQIKGIKDKLEKIPVRLEEQHKALPENLDWDAITTQSDFAKKELAEVDQKILSIKSGNGQDIKKEELRKALNTAQAKLDLMEGMARSNRRNKEEEMDKAISELSRQFTSLLNIQHDLESSIGSFDTLSKRCKEMADKTFKSEQAYIREHWKETQVEFNENDAMCPYCHQVLPDNMLSEAKEKFNQHKAELKEQFTKRANDAKKLLADAETEASEYIQKKAEAEKNLTDTKESLNKIFSDKQKLEKEKAALPSLEQILKDDKGYQDLLAEVSVYMQEIELASVSNEEDKSQLTELEAKKAQIEAEIANYQTELATKVQYDKIQSLIEGIKQEQKDLVTQLSELERKEDVAARYQSKQNQILEERINQHFSLVQWKMFRTVNNGGDPYDEPFCECYVDGVAYHDGLNQAARLNAGLDIINCLCRHYNVSAPIIIDQSESTLNILETTSQQVRLCVSDCDLNVE